MRRPIVLHPFLFALYPALALLAVNVAWVTPHQVVRSVLTSLALAFALYAALWLILRNPLKAALVTSLLIVPLFGYGQMYDGLRAAGLGTAARHRYLAPALLALLALGTVAILRTRRDLRPLNHALNLIATLSLALPMLTLLGSEADRLTSPAADLPEESVPGLAWADPGPPPDIYLIVLDAYAREDVLQTVFNYENAPTLDALRELGFFVADGSRANHAQTGLSLASLLNMDYVGELLPQADPDSANRDALWQLVQHSLVRRSLESLGYSTVAFATGLEGTELQDADAFLAPQTDPVRFDLRGLTAFESMLLDGTGIRAMTDLSVALPEFFPDSEAPFDAHRDRINFVFDQLPVLPSTPGPKFVVAHVIAPHPPFVFGPNGEARAPDGPFTLGDAGEPAADSEYIGAYRDQIRYIDKRLVETVQAILKNSERPPIIILQADHGPEGKHASVSYPQERMTILNALYLPDGGDRSLYSTITPVNTFRLILREYFQGEVELLPDRVLYSEYRRPYDFIDLTDEIE